MQELVVESLVVSLTMVMLDVLVDDEAQMPFAERDDTMEALLFDRPDEPLGIGVEIRAVRRQPDRPNIATCQDLAKDPRVEGIAVMLDRRIRRVAASIEAVPAGGHPERGRDRARAAARRERGFRTNPGGYRRR